MYNGTAQQFYPSIITKTVDKSFLACYYNKVINKVIQRSNKMAITKLKHHDNCEVSIHRCKPNSAHFAALRCRDCNTHIQWLNRQEADKIQRIINENFAPTRGLFDSTTKWEAVQ